MQFCLMFKKLQSKWAVSPLQLVLVLITFAVGGSLSGVIARAIMSQFNISSKLIYLPLYLFVVTLAWPICVLSVSIFTGQFSFFRKYLVKLGVKFRLISPIRAIDPSGTVNIAVFASGAGSNAQKIIDHFRHHPTIKVALIVCNKPQAGVLTIAGNENIPALLIEKETFFRGNAYVPQLQDFDISFIVLAGFLWKIPDALIKAFPNAIINIHPALLPKFGGKGMYGMNVHQAVIEAREKESGITIHYVNNHYDEGEVIFQATCSIDDTDTAETLAAKIHQLEHQNFPAVIENLLKQR